MPVAQGHAGVVFERFAEPPRRVLVVAQDEARQLGHNFIGTEHILLALVGDESSAPARVLARMGADHGRLRQAVEGRQVPLGGPRLDRVEFTPEAKKALELSLRESLRLGHNYVGSEHVLLGVLRDDRSAAAELLRAMAADLEDVRRQVVEGFVPVAPTVTAFSVDGPHCHRCGQRLDLRFRDMEASGDDWTGPSEARSVTVVYCGLCGTVLATLAPPIGRDHLDDQ